MVWVKGQSGNPGGRKGQARVTRLAREALRADDGGDKAIKRLAEIVETGDNSEAVAAAKVLLPYAYGAPRQSVDVSVSGGGRPVREWSSAELAAFIAREESRETAAEGTEH